MTPSPTSVPRTTPRTTPACPTLWLSSVERSVLRMCLCDDLTPHQVANRSPLTVQEVVHLLARVVHDLRLGACAEDDAHG